MGTVFDHIFVLTVAVALPVYTWLVWFPKIVPRLQRNEPGLRRRVYLQVMAEQWALCFAAIAIWAAAGRPWEWLGFRASLEWPFWAGLGFSALWGLLFWAQLNAVRKSAEVRAAMRKQIDAKVGAIIPHAPDEIPAYYGLSITAGVCEEVLMRGYLMAYLGQWMELWPAVGVSSVIFGLAHLYQGPANAVRTGVMGLLFGTAYALTGSLWTPILMHALLDAFSGLTAYVALTDSGTVGTEALE